MTRPERSALFPTAFFLLKETPMSAHQLCSAALVLLTLFIGSAPASDQIPGAPQRKPIALTNAAIHPITSQDIPVGTLVFDKGRITAMGAQVQIPADAEVIDVQGRHVYPGLIEAHSQLGLREISSTKATLDSYELGQLNPGLLAHVAVNPDSEVIPVTRANGVLLTLTAPSGSLVSGQASVIQLDGWTWEQMTLKPSAAMVVQWPSSEDEVTTLRKLFADAKAWQAARGQSNSRQRYDVQLDAMQSVLNGDLPLLIAADTVSRIQAAVAFCAEHKVRMILFGGYDAPECAELLRKYEVPVIVDAIHRDPRRNHDDYDAAFTLPLRLQQAGLSWCISGSGRGETWNTRNLPYQAGTAIAWGLSHEEALRSITLYPAQILGIADRVGSLAVGMDATLIVTEGDPLETASHVTRAWIQGRRVDLTSRHTQLRDKYTEKYRQLRDTP